MKRFGSATWNGDLREGKGSTSTESRALESHPYSFFSRYGEKPGINPEELLGRRSRRLLHYVIRQTDSAWRTSCRSRMAAKACAHSAHQRNWYILNRGDWRCRL